MDLTDHLSNTVAGDIHPPVGMGTEDDGATALLTTHLRVTLRQSELRNPPPVNGGARSCHGAE